MSLRAWFRVGTVLLAGAAALSGCGSSGGGGKSSSAGGKASVQVTAPADGSVSHGDRVTVRGTVTPPDATVQILGRSAAVGNGVFTGSVPLHRGSNQIDVVASAPGSTPATTTITITRPRPKAGKPVALLQMSKGAVETGPPPLSGSNNCGNGLTAGANTSCPFAENVRSEYNRSGAGVLEVFSPTTGQTYRVYCTATSPHVCTGGNNASVYFGDATGYSMSGCGAGIVVGPNTSCGFAQNVRDEYERTGSSVLSVFSPATGRTYRVYCTSGSPHACTGGNNAAVYFP